MKTIVCFGDSNTWGYDPRTKKRFPPDVRWTGVLARTLGSDYRVIEEGLNGRTTVWDDPIEGRYPGHKQGKSYLYPCLESHMPLDLITTMLGTNDFKRRFNVSALDIAWGMRELVEIAQQSKAGIDEQPPLVLVMAPPPLASLPGTPYADIFDGVRSEETSRQLAEQYRLIAEEAGCHFFNAGDVIVSSAVDAIHFDPEEHSKLGAAVAAKIKQILG